MSVSVHRAYLPRDERRNQILGCALAVFASKGFHETSIADICARAHIARGTLYQYFTDKRGVLSALVDRIVRRVIDAIQHWTPLELPLEVAWTEEDNVTFVEARCTQIMEVVFADADTASLIRRVAHGTGFLGKALAQIDEHVVGSSRRSASRLTGALRPLDPQIVAEFIVDGIEKIVLRALDDGRAIDIARISREIAVLVSSGLLPGKPPPPASTIAGFWRAPATEGV
jgi:AcrR family transcriptional regulator